VERLILDDLLKWKNSKFRKPLILKGVRQVGKTWILKEFGKRYYDHVAYFNFDEYSEYKQFFETTKDIERILQNLMLASGQKITKEKTLIIFDEVQDCPNVLNSMKYFYENANEYHVACAGSLLGIALAKPSSFPVGMVDFMQINPMTFKEFLIAGHRVAGGKQLRQEAVRLNQCNLQCGIAERLYAQRGLRCSAFQNQGSVLDAGKVGCKWAKCRFIK